MKDETNENNIENSSYHTEDDANILYNEENNIVSENDVVDEIPEKPFNLKKEVFEWFYTIAIALAVAFIVKGFFFDFVNVSGNSMFPTLYHGDMLIVRKIGYTPKQGDVIILDSNYKNREAYYDKLEQQEGKEYSDIKKFFHNFTIKDESIKKRYYVKRVIALPGQTVDIKDGSVYVDGQKIDESYLQANVEVSDNKAKVNGRSVTPSSFDKSEFSVGFHTENKNIYIYGRELDDSHFDTFPLTAEYPVTVKEGHVFVLGDNRGHSADSRSPSLGQVPYEAIMGKAVFRLWPLNGFGTI